MSISLAEYEKLLDAKMSERELLERVQRSLKAGGWLWNHNPPNVIRCPGCKTEIKWWTRRGLPDLQGVHDAGFLILPELKTEKGKPTPDQQSWLDRLSRVHTVLTGLWRPRHLRDIGDFLLDPVDFITKGRRIA